MIEADTVVAIHDAILATEPGLHGGHGVGPLEGALGRVSNAIEYDGVDDVYEIAALYAVAISRGHVFNDANKRTALVTSLTYLAMQGVEIERSAALEDIMVDVAQGQLSQQELAELLFAIANWASYADQKAALSLEAVEQLQRVVNDVSATLRDRGVNADPSFVHSELAHIVQVARSARRNFEKSRWAAYGADGEFHDWLAKQDLSDLID